MIELIAELLVPGMMALRICSMDPNDRRGEVLIDPNYVVLIYRNDETPAGCIKIMTVVGRGIFVYGNEKSVAAVRAKALQEQHEIERQK